MSDPIDHAREAVWRLIRDELSAEWQVIRRAVRMETDVEAALPAVVAGRLAGAVMRLFPEVNNVIFMDDDEKPTATSYQLRTRKEPTP